MVSPISGYTQNVIPTVATRDSGLQPAAAVAGAGASGLSSSSIDVGITQRANQVPSGTGLSRQNIALLEAMQAGRETSALLSTLMGPGDSFFQAPSPSSITPQGQSTPQRPSLALLESMQAGRATSALLSSVMGSAPGVRSLDSLAAMRTQGNAAFANPQAALTNAQDIMRAAGSGQPWIQDSGVAHLAYLMEIQAQRQVDRQSMGSNLTHQWFA